MPAVNHANCFDQEAVRHTYGNLIYGIRLLLDPPLFISAFHQDWKCAWGMLRQPCLNYSLTLWPSSCIDTTVQTGTIAPGLHLCAQLLQDNVGQWNPNCGACACTVFVFRASPLNCGGAQSCSAQRYTWKPPPPPKSTLVSSVRTANKLL